MNDAIKIITANEDGTETVEVVKIHVVNSAEELEALFDGVAVLAEVPEGAEVYELMASTPDVAAQVGRERAEEWTRRGYPMVCLGVIAHAARTVFCGEVHSYQGFQPVLKGVC